MSDCASWTNQNAPSFAELLLAIPQGDVKFDREAKSSFDQQPTELRTLTKRRKQTQSEALLRVTREE